LRDETHFLIFYFENSAKFVTNFYAEDKERHLHKLLISDEIPRHVGSRRVEEGKFTGEQVIGV